MKRSPNSEQLMAIEHHGGVLLKAGAGSGKTFVLVEHIAYLTSGWIAEKGESADFEHYIKEKFSKVVMMTFTNKAAGEMKLRLYKKFDELVSEHQSKAWETAREYLTWLTVTTIDGFCRKLIVSGYFAKLSTTADIIFEEQRSSQVEKILENWFQINSSSVEPYLRDQLIRSKSEIRDSFCKIFNDPSKRLKWKFIQGDEFSDEKLNLLIESLYRIHQISQSVGVISQYDIPADANKYEKDLIERFQRMGLPEIHSWDILSAYYSECSVRAPALTAKMKTPELERVSEAYKELREWVKDTFEMILDFKENRESLIIPWFQALYSIYEYVDSKLSPNDGFTFGDIEYYVSLGLDDPESQKRICKDFEYFIVDEFQDTSFLQFSIIKKLIKNDFNKLFCVGDAKQAIYGFRGGELAVFDECSRLIPRNLSLANNYRSLAEVIEANNSIFEHVLPIGFKLSEHDPFTVHFEPQTLPPIEYKAHGEIIINDLDLSHIEAEKISNEQLDALESKIIADQVEKLLTQFPTKQNTILYKKLDPSTGVIRHLMNKNIGFTAQFKIELLDDPVLGIFYTLLKRFFDKNEKSKNEFHLSIINNYLQVLGVKEICQIETIQKFEQDLHYYGLLEAYKKFIFSLYVTNENADLNLKYISLLCELYDNNLSVIFSRFKQTGANSISMDLRWGTNSSKVVIMSAHASKGLEFDHVIIGGIFTNSANIPNKNIMGDNPQSFYWYKNFEEKEKVVTPFYQYDRDVDKFKNYSESKRLLYVACTRAVEKLIWTKVDLGELQKKIKENSWSSLLDDWLVKTRFNKLSVNKLDPDSYSFIISEKQPLPLPLFYYDSVGVYQKDEEQGELLIVPELSVTRLNSLLQCSRKFYLQNVIKLNAMNDESFEVEDDLASFMKSSAARGTSLHEALSRAVSRNFVVPREFVGTKDEKILTDSLQKLQQFSPDYEFISEVPIKFSFFGHIISGTPDLILRPKADGKYQVWDFKTGRLKESKLNPYWLQLKVYAFALFTLGQVSRENSILLELYFIDEQKNLSLEVSFSELREELLAFWKKQSRPWEINPEHCSQCEYGDICLR